MSIESAPTITVRGRYVRETETETTFCRERLARSDAGTVTTRGLLRTDGEQSHDWHVRTTRIGSKDVLDRAILVQSETHWSDIAAAALALREPLPEGFRGGDFGENILVSGVSADDLCVGDILALSCAALAHVFGPLSPLAAAAALVSHISFLPWLLHCSINRPVRDRSASRARSISSGHSRGSQIARGPSEVR